MKLDVVYIYVDQVTIKFKDISRWDKNYGAFMGEISVESFRRHINNPSETLIFMILKIVV